MGEVKGSVLERLKGAFIKYVTLIGGFFDPLVLLNGCFTYNFRQSITRVGASPPPPKKKICLVVKWSGFQMVVRKPNKNICFIVLKKSGF